MPDSPASQTPYEVLGVAPTAGIDELKRAYRRLLRETHPDVGGDAARFHAVQHAWAIVGDPEARARYDRTRVGAPERAQRGSSRSRSSGPRARSHGHPGGWSREQYLAHIREWAGRGVEVPDPYDAALVHSAPRAVRRLLAEALAEEATARALVTLGIGYTIWNDVAAPADKIDHVVLGPAGLFAMRSQDWGSEVRLVRGELKGEGLATGEQPLRELSRAARSLGRSLGVRFTGVLIVVPDDHLDEDVSVAGRKADAAVLRASSVPRVLRDGLREERLSLDVVFDVRERLQRGVRFV